MVAIQNKTFILIYQPLDDIRSKSWCQLLSLRTRNTTVSFRKAGDDSHHKFSKWLPCTKNLFDISASMSLMLQCWCVNKHFQGQRMNILFRKAEYEHENMQMTN